MEKPFDFVFFSPFIHLIWNAFVCHLHTDTVAGARGDYWGYCTGSGTPGYKRVGISYYAIRLGFVLVGAWIRIIIPYVRQTSFWQGKSRERQRTFIERPCSTPWDYKYLLLHFAIITLLQHPAHACSLRLMLFEHDATQYFPYLFYCCRIANNLLLVLLL